LVQCFGAGHPAKENSSDVKHVKSQLFLLFWVVVLGFLEELLNKFLWITKKSYTGITEVVFINKYSYYLLNRLKSQIIVCFLVADTFSSGDSKPFVTYLSKYFLNDFLL